MNYCKPIKNPFLLGVKLEEANSTPLVNNTLYRKQVGCLIYLTHTRSDIYYAVSVAYRYMDQNHEIHWRKKKIILHFVQGTRTHGIHYVAKYDLELVGFTDSNWAGDNSDSVGLREDLGSILLSLHQQNTHSVGPFGNNLRRGCSLTRNSYGVPQNQIFASKRGILLYLLTSNRL